MNDRPTVECDVETLVIRVPMKFKKRGGRKEIIVPDGLSGAGAHRVSHSHEVQSPGLGQHGPFLLEEDCEAVDQCGR